MRSKLNLAWGFGQFIPLRLAKMQYESRILVPSPGKHLHPGSQLVVKQPILGVRSGT